MVPAKGEDNFVASKKTEKRVLMDAKIIGSKIAKARREANMSQAQLAQGLFITPQAVGKWERGESIPDIVTMNRLAEILGVDLNYFSANFRHEEGEIIAKAVIEVGEQKEEGGNDSSSPERPLLANFSGRNLLESDFSGVTAHSRKFNGSALRGSDFAGADLTGSSFSGSDVREANFDRANLTDCIFPASDLSDATFNQTILMRTEFSASALVGAKFVDAKLADAKLTKTDLRKTIFENCTFEGVDFKHSDLSGLRLDGQTFIGVKFSNAALTEATFNGSTLKNVSFEPTFALTNKYYKAIQTINFDGAAMDKLTYAALKGMGAELAKVMVI
jgi:uncharacterized protein YjbI with pentapeptide repeats